MTARLVSFLRAQLREKNGTPTRYPGILVSDGYPYPAGMDMHTPGYCTRVSAAIRHTRSEGIEEDLLGSYYDDLVQMMKAEYD